MDALAPVTWPSSVQSAPTWLSLVQPEVLPSGFALPPVPYLVAVLLAVAGTVGLLYRVDPAVTPRVVAAFAPWMVDGAALYALFQADAVPDLIAPFFGSPTVYLSTFVVAGLVWAFAARFPADEWAYPSAPALLVLTGSVSAGATVGLAVTTALARGTLSLYWPVVGLVLSLGLGLATWAVLRRAVPGVRVTGAAGVVAVVGHALDGVSTAIGTDVYEFAEQTPLSRVIIELGAGLPPAGFLGTAWLFVVVKLLVASLVVWALIGSVEDAPRQGLLLLGLVAAVGLGPGAHNLVLFVIA